MQTENDYDNEVYNGDLGVVSRNDAMSVVQRSGLGADICVHGCVIYSTPYAGSSFVSRATRRMTSACSDCDKLANDLPYISMAIGSARAKKACSRSPNSRQ